MSLLFAGILLLVESASAEPGERGRAWVTARKATVRAAPSTSARVLAILERGDSVELEGCVPSCDARDGWAFVIPVGAIRLSLLALDAPDGMAEEPFRHGRVKSPGAPIFTGPDEETQTLGTRPTGHVLAFRARRPGTGSEEWLELVAGGYVQASSVELLEPSDFFGELLPELPLAFFIRGVSLKGALTTTAVTRFSRAPIREISPAGVLLDEGLAPRRAVRVATLRERPVEIPPDARWVHVSLSEQVLVAYEGDNPVFATLVSTGKGGFETSVGVFRVWLKVRHIRMHGTREPYEVDEVPFVMFFHNDEALHGAFWHARFGTRLSHGCINLSVEDARWLFDWASPALPERWHSILPLEAQLDTLWVVVAAD
ncbi:MAG: L,D-transpeptidase family protein [Myxococcaceae bacterium]